MEETLLSGDVGVEPVTFNNIRVKRRRMGLNSLGQIINGIILRPSMVFGCSQTLEGPSILALGGDEVAYIAGNHLVRYDFKTKVQRFLYKKKEESEVTCLACSQSPTQFFAFGFAASGKSPAKIKLYHSRKRLIGSFKLLLGESVTHLAFSRNQRILFFVSESSEGRRLLNALELGSTRLVGSVGLDGPVGKMDTHGPMKKACVAAVAGKLAVFRLRAKEGRIETMPHEASLPTAVDTAVDAFCEDSQAELFFAASGTKLFSTFRGKLSEVDLVGLGGLGPSEAEVSSLAFGRGKLLVGLKGAGTALLFGVSPSGDLDFLGPLLFSTGAASTQHVVVSRDGGFAALAIRRGAAEPPNAGVTELVLFDFALLEAGCFSPGLSSSSPLGQGSFPQAITDAALAENRGYLALLAGRRQVKVLNLGPSAEREVCGVTLLSPVLAVAIHPSGLWLALAQEEKIAVFAVLEGELRETLSLSVRDPGQLCYSERGDLLLVSSGGSIIVYDAYSLDKLWSPPAAHAGRIRQLMFRSRDSKVVSLCSSSGVYIWDSSRWDREVMFAPPARAFAVGAVEFDAELDLIALICSDARLRVLYDRGGFETASLEFGGEAPVSLRLAKEQRALLVGMSGGGVRVYSWPLFPNSSAGECMQFSLHQGPLSLMLLSAGRDLLVTAGPDAAVFVSRVRWVDKDRDGRGDDQPPPIPVSIRRGGEEDSSSTRRGGEEQPSIDAGPAETLEPLEEPDMWDKMAELDEDPRPEDADRPRVLALEGFGLMSLAQQRVLRGSLLDMRITADHLKNDLEDQSQSLKRRLELERRAAEEARKQRLRDQKTTLTASMDAETQEELHLSAANRATAAARAAAEAAATQRGHEKLLALYAEAERRAEDAANRRAALDEALAAAAERRTVDVAEARAAAQRKLDELAKRFEAAVAAKALDARKFSVAHELLDAEFRVDHRALNDTLTRSLLAQREENFKLTTENAKLRRETFRFGDKRSALESLISEGTRQNALLAAEIGRLAAKSREIDSLLRAQARVINGQELELGAHRRRNEFLESSKRVFDYLAGSLRAENAAVRDFHTAAAANQRVVRAQLTEEAEASKKLDDRIKSLGSKLESAKAKISDLRADEARQKATARRLLAAISEAAGDFSLEESQLAARVAAAVAAASSHGGAVEAPSKAPEIELFKEEVTRLSKLFKAKKKEAAEGLDRARAAGQSALGVYQYEGRELIQRCLEHREKRARHVGEIMQRKQEVDSLVKQFSFLNLRGGSGKLSLPFAASKPNMTASLPFELYRAEAETRRFKPKNTAVDSPTHPGAAPEPPRATTEDQRKKLALTSENIVKAAVRDFRTKGSLANSVFRPPNDSAL